MYDFGLILRAVSRPNVPGWFRAGSVFAAGFDPLLPPLHDLLQLRVSAALL